MAKRKSKPTKKKATGKKRQTKGSSKNVPLVFFLLLVVAGVVIYGLYETGRFTNTPINKTSASSGKNTKERSKDSNSESASDNANSSKKFDTKDINAKDKLVESSKANENLPDYSNSDAYYYTSSFDFGWPAYDESDAIVEHQYYALSYNEKTEQPTWVAYQLTKENLTHAQYKRKDDFRSDPNIISKSATLADYKGSGYDRGHLAPAADFTWNEEALSETFFMSNMSPQEPGFNRGIWKKLEGKVRDWAKSNHKIYVVTGPITKLMSKRIGDNKVAVPSHYYKAILDIQEPGVKAIGFVMKNKKSSEDIMKFSMSIDDLERQTGLDFFPGIPDNLEEQIESTLDTSLWK